MALVHRAGRENKEELSFLTLSSGLDAVNLTLPAALPL